MKAELACGQICGLQRYEVSNHNASGIADSAIENDEICLPHAYILSYLSPFYSLLSLVIAALAFFLHIDE